MFEFAALPPEVNSGRMYTGPGAGPMLAAAVAWDGLAADLYSTASAYTAEVSGLTDGSWAGPSATAMANSAVPQAAWLYQTAAQAEQVADQVRAVVRAFETAFAMTVPPPVVAANRTLLAALIATNFFGQNTPAIAATEAHYAEMWAQDAIAMCGYAADSAAHATPPSFSAPQPLSPAAPSAAAPITATGSWTGILQTLLQMGLPPIVSQLGQDLFSVFEAPIVVTQIITRCADEFIVGAIQGWPSAWQPPPLLAAASAKTVASYSPAGRPVSAGLRNATAVGKLSAPRAWAAAAPEMSAGAETPSDTAGLRALGDLAADVELGNIGQMPSLFGATPLVTRANRDNRDESPEEPDAPAGGNRQRLPRHWR